MHTKVPVWGLNILVHCMRKKGTAAAGTPEANRLLAALMAMSSDTDSLCFDANGQQAQLSTLGFWQTIGLSGRGISANVQQ